MVSELFTNATAGLAQFYMLSPENTVYLFAFLFSVCFAIIAGVRTGRPMVGLVIFFVSLFAFSLLGAFPLWIVALPVIIIIFIGRYAFGGGE